MNIFTKITIVLLFTIAALLSAQDKKLASFSNQNITSSEFIKRFELTPRIRSSANIDTQKTHFLYTLLAEKLWAEEARNRNLDTLYSYKQYQKNLEKMMVRDALFKREIESRVIISENEINTALSKKRFELQLKFLFSNSVSEINSLYKRLGNTSIDTLLKNRYEASEQSEPITVVFGQMNKILEDTLFNLSVGEFTRPIYNEIGWVIYYLVDKRELSATKLGDIQSSRSEVIRIISDRQKEKLVNEYLKELLTGIVADTDGELFQKLAIELSNLLNERYEGKSFDNYILYEADIIKLIKSVSNKKFGEPFIKFEQNPITYREFLFYIYFNNFSAPGKDLESVRASLNSVVHDFISLEVVAREGYRQKLDLLPEVQDELKMWSDNYLSQYLRNTYNTQAKVSETELNNYLSEKIDSNISTKFVSITEVKLNSLEQAQHIISQLRFNYEFEEILKQMNFPPTAIFRSDKPEPLSSFGDLATIIENMREGEVYGPIVRAAGKYSIIKLNKTEERALTGDEKNKLQVDTQKEILFYKKLGNILSRKTIEFAKQSNLQIYDQVLSEITVTEIPTLIYRYYGFGGQTVAAPFLNLFYEWFYQYKSEEDKPL